MRAIIVSPGAEAGEGEGGELGLAEETEMRFSPVGVEGARVMSMSCHQSSSTVFLTPLSVNHCWMSA
jgi:hypothetical protein